MAQTHQNQENYFYMYVKIHSSFALYVWMFGLLRGTKKHKLHFSLRMAMRKFKLVINLWQVYCVSLVHLNTGTTDN